MADALDQGRKVAVVYGTHGDAGNNEFGPEQALVMGQVREIEARRALASLDITNAWFLSRRYTTSQNVLYSLELGPWIQPRSTGENRPPHPAIRHPHFPSRFHYR